MYLDINEIVNGKILPISKSTFLREIKKGRYPQPIRLSPRVLVWDKDDLMEAIEKLK